MRTIQMTRNGEIIHSLEVADDEAGRTLQRWRKQAELDSRDGDECKAELVPLPTPEPTAEELAARRKGEILRRLAELDAASVRPLRAINAKTASAADTSRLAEIEAEAATLRAELAGL
jgi:hypothetical protein